MPADAFGLSSSRWCPGSRKQQLDAGKCYLEWAFDNSNVDGHIHESSARPLVRVMERNIPDELCPIGVKTLTIFDVIVQSRGPDDAVYLANSEIWNKVARGNAVLQVEFDNGTLEQLLIVQGLRKFTGYCNYDDDDIDDVDGKLTAEWRKFFLDDIDAIDHIVLTEKENGEAAHLACIELGYDNARFLIIGSKNVHLVARSAADLDHELYQQLHFQFARRIAQTVFTQLDQLPRRDLLLQYLCDTGYTANFEHIDPSSQHIVFYESKEPQLKFFCWTSPLSLLDVHGLCAPPHTALTEAHGFGLDTVFSRVFAGPDHLPALEYIRGKVNSEGAVLYCVDGACRTIGLWKVKTAWYVISRAIRQKILAWNIGPIDRRVDQLVTWFQLGALTASQWKRAAHRFVAWLRFQRQHGNFEWSTLFEHYAELLHRCERDTGFTFDDSDMHWTNSCIVFFCFERPGLAELVARTLSVFLLNAPLTQTEEIKFASRDHRLFVCGSPLPTKNARSSVNKLLRRNWNLHSLWVCDRSHQSQPKHDPKSRRHVIIVQQDKTIEDALSDIVGKVRAICKMILRSGA